MRFGSRGPSEEVRASPTRLPRIRHQSVWPRRPWKMPCSDSTRSDLAICNLHLLKVVEVRTPLLSDLAAFCHRHFWRVSRLSGGRYFRVAKTCIVHGPYEVAIKISRQLWKHAHFLFGETCFMLLLFKINIRQNYLITVWIFTDERNKM